MKISQSGDVVNVEFHDVTPDWRQDILLRSDAHHDSLLCDREAELEDLNEAKRRNALIIDAGDIFDLMQGRFDARKSYDEIRPEFLSDRYYDLAINDAINFYKPYAENFIVIARGNHDSSVIKNAGTDPVDRLVTAINGETGNICRGQAGGWVRFMFFNPAVDDKKPRRKCTLNLAYHHSGGSGSESPVTKGVIQTNRQSGVYPDANVILNGHTHTAYWLPVPRHRLTERGEQYQDIQHFVRTPGYKMPGNWEKGIGMLPKSRGCVWMTLSINSIERPNVMFTPNVR